MTAGWMLASLLVPPAVAIMTAAIAKRVTIPPAAAIALNGICPGSGLVVLERPLLEIALCVLMGQAAMVVAGGLAMAGSLAPFMFAAAVWAAAYTPLNPLGPDRSRPTTPSPPAARTALGRPARGASPVGRDAAAATDHEGDVGYSVSVRCTECGAEVAVPVLRRMARCEFCESDHLVVGHDETLWLTLPAAADDERSLREALLDHFRYREYLRLYQRSVAPLQRQAVDAGPTGGLVSRPEVDAAAAVAEAAAARAADAYRQRLATRFELVESFRFLSPYRHGVGTLYQATFGRRRADQEKQLSFTIGTVEAATAASDAMDLPGMGKLSYLRALQPAAETPPEIRTLPLDGDESRLLTAFGDLDRKRLDRDLDVIRLGSRFEREVTAVVWRPWWLAAVRAAGIDERLLVDGATGSVVGPAPFLNREVLEELPATARATGAGLRFVPMECPTCGDEFPFDGDAVVHFCRNCHRAFEVVGERKRERPYVWDGECGTGGGSHMVPFWQFPFRLRTAAGQLITDLRHLKDGIDGTYDQLGEVAQERDQTLLVPAIRCITSRLTTSAYNRLFRWAVANPPTLAARRVPLDERPRPLPVCLSHDDAKRIAPLYLANAFNRRDVARVNVHQVSDWLFEAELESHGHLAFAAVPAVVTEPFRAYVGRPHVNALS